MNKTAKASVLVAEDSITAAKRLQFCLERSGYSVEIASDGLEAWQKVQQQQFDVVLTDEQMPLMTGQELCRRLRADNRHARTPIIFLTAKLFELDVDEIEKELKITTTLGKPFSADSLIQVIEAELAAARTAEGTRGAIPR
jgi:CheY-like chemotaxis protein